MKSKIVFLATIVLVGFALICRLRAQKKVIKLKFASILSYSSDICIESKFCDEIKKRTNGRVEHQSSQQTVPAQRSQIYQGVVSGIPTSVCQIFPTQGGVSRNRLVRPSLGYPE